MPTEPAPVLVRSVAPPARAPGWYVMALGLVVAAFAAAGAAVPLLILSAGPDLEATERAFLADHVGEPLLLNDELVLAAEPEPEAVPADADIHFVEVVDGTAYLILSPVAGTEDGVATLPPGAASPRLIGTLEDPRGAVAAIDASTSTELGAWSAREVVLDNGCRARVESFAVLSRMTGDVGYMAVDEHPTATAVARAVMRDGSPHFAAVLDGCEGTFAYPSDHSAPVVPTAVSDAALLKAARKRLLASPAAKRANTQWTDAGHEGSWITDQWTEVDVRAYRHPRTGVTTVSAMANADVGCGGADIQLWALYDVGADGVWTERFAGTPDLFTIDAALDRDGDGVLEWLGTSQLGDRSMIEIQGTEQVTLAQLRIPFFGCPC